MVANRFIDLLPWKRFLGFALLGCFCCAGDTAMQLPWISRNMALRAIADNGIHAVIGLWCWSLVSGLQTIDDVLQTILCGVLSSAVDLDHFIAAKSFSLKDLNCIANENPQVVVLKLELRDTSSIEECANKVEKIVGDSGLNVLINNGAIMKEPLTDRMKDTTEEMLNRTLGVNVVGTAMVTKYFLPMVRTAARGLKEYDSSKASIFNISSEWSSVSTLDHRQGHYNYPYSMSKASVNMMTRLLAMEFKENNEKILCMCIEPGWLMTEIGNFMGPTPPEESAKALLKVFATRTEAHHGGFYTHEGKDFPF